VVQRRDSVNVEEVLMGKNAINVELDFSDSQIAKNATVMFLESNLLQDFCLDAILLWR
jgi:hypothetical protein